MDLKKYMILSFATLWTLVLIITLIVSIIHNIYYQDSASQFNLEYKLQDLQQDLSNKDQEILRLEDRIKKITWWWYYP